MFFYFVYFFSIGLLYISFFFSMNNSSIVLYLDHHLISTRVKWTQLELKLDLIRFESWRVCVLVWYFLLSVYDLYAVFCFAFPLIFFLLL